MPGSPIVSFSTTSNFEHIYDDKGSGAHMNGSFYRPEPQEGFYILGDYAQGDYHPPNGTVFTIKVENDDQKNPVLQAPEDYIRIWTDHHSGAHEDGSFWAPKPPFGYVTCGHVIQRGYDKPQVSTLRCLRYDYAKQIKLGALIWNDRGSGAHDDVSIYRLDPVNTFIAVPNYNTPTEGSWAPKGLFGSQ